MRRPPAVPTWLAQRLVSNQALLGDLVEQFGSGRSGAWYWRQAFSAVLIGAMSDLREHKLLAVRAVLLGWVILIPWFYFTVTMYRRSASWMDMWIPGAWAEHGSVLLQAAWWGWWIYAMPLLTAWHGASLMIGWVIARLHRGHQAAMVFACVASQLPWTALWAWPVWRNAQMGLAHTAYDFPNQVHAVLLFVGVPICTLLGGLWRVRTRGRVIS
jgi:hypothetical protein